MKLGSNTKGKKIYWLYKNTVCDLPIALKEAFEFLVIAATIKSPVVDRPSGYLASVPHVPVVENHIIKARQRNKACC